MDKKNISNNDIEFIHRYYNTLPFINKSKITSIISVIKNNIYDKDGFDLLDTKAYCLSLSDQYWVKMLDEDILWEDVNFFDNEFSEDVGKLLFDGLKTSVDLNLNTPDMTSNGNYLKRWKIINKDRYLVKAGGKMINQEPFNEVIATKLYERLLNDNEYVKYEIIYDNGRAVSICKDFITTDTELIPAWKINEYYEKMKLKTNMNII